MRDRDTPPKISGSCRPGKYGALYSPTAIWKEVITASFRPAIININYERYLACWSRHRLSAHVPFYPIISSYEKSTETILLLESSRSLVPGDLTQRSGLLQIMSNYGNQHLSG